MFRHTGDPASVVAVREHELAAIQDWVAAFNDAYAHTHHRLKSVGATSCDSEKGGGEGGKQEQC